MKNCSLVIVFGNNLFRVTPVARQPLTDTEDVVLTKIEPSEFRYATTKETREALEQDDGEKFCTSLEGLFGPIYCGVWTDLQSKSATAYRMHVSEERNTLWKICSQKTSTFIQNICSFVAVFEE